MVFNLKNSILSLILSTTLFSCVGTKADLENENLIGNKLDSITALKTNTGADSSAVVLFDPTLQKIHQFNLDQMSVVRTLNVLNPTQKHYVLHDSAGNFIVDLSSKHLTIFDKQSNAQNNPIQFFGKPLSAAFRPELGLLVMYDDLQNAGIVNMNSDGHVEKAYTFGSIVSNDQTIVSGDLLEDGNLVLALSDNSLAQVNVSQSLLTEQWVSQIQPTGLSEIRWVAPIPSSPNLIFVKSKNQVSLYDLNLQTVVSSIAISGQIEKYSKNFNPHIIERVDYRTLKLIYTDGLTVKTRLLNREHKTILASDLDLTQNMWSFVESPTGQIDPNANNLNIYKYNREFVRFRVSDMAALQSKSIPDRAEVKLANQFYFCLFPSDLGYATKNSILTENVSVMKNFNLKNY